MKGGIEALVLTVPHLNHHLRRIKTRAQRKQNCDPILLRSGDFRALVPFFFENIGATMTSNAVGFKDNETYFSLPVVQRWWLIYLIHGHL